MRFASLTIVVLCFLASPADAWHAAGHRLTAEIAFDLLNEEQQRRIAAILRAHPRFGEDFAKAMPGAVARASEAEQARWMLAHASNWPDRVRNISESVRERYHRSTWHYINLPVFLTEHDEAQLKHKLDQNVSMEYSPPLRRRLNIVQALKGNLRVWRDQSATNTEKAVALCWILHLAGDLHQPLHNVALFGSDYFPKGDRGGNLIGIRRWWRTTNLHALWDGLANRFKTLTADDRTQELLQSDVVTIDSIAAWASQHRDMAEEFAYSEEVKRKLLAQRPDRKKPMIRLSRGYIATAGKIAESQIIIAGHRIASLISD